MATADDLKDTLKKFNKGVKTVELDKDMFTVHVTSKKSAAGVTMDLLKSRAFKSVVAMADNINGGFDVYATVK